MTLGPVTEGAAQKSLIYWNISTDYQRLRRIDLTNKRKIEPEFRNLREKKG